MSDRDDPTRPRGDQDKLRREALERLRARRRPVDRDPEIDLEALVHELEVHEVELEVQNEELRRAQAELVEARDRYRDLYERAPFGYLTLDADGVVRRANQATSRLGLDPSEVLHRRFESLVTAESRDACYRLIRRAARSEAPVHAELSLDTPEGGVRWAHIEIGRVSAGGERAGGFRVALTDISERRAAIEERLALERERGAQKEREMERLGALTGGLAHGFNNLLQTVVGNVELVSDALPEDSQWRQRLEDATAAARQGGELTYLMLAYAGKATRRVRPLDVSSVVHDMTSALESTAGGVELDVEAAPDLPAIDADMGQVQIVLFNLVANAAEAMREGGGHGAIHVRTGRRRVSAEELKGAAGGGAEPGEYVFVSVGDSGPGMDAEAERRMFEPFFTTRPEHRGLGLSAVLGIVRTHGGDVLVDTGPGRGTRVTALFPPGRARSPARTETTGAAKPRGSGLVLVADDEPTIRDISRALLESVGFTVRVAADGAEALELYRELRDELVCVVLDVSMPRMTGLQVTRAIQGMDPDAPVVLMSGYTEAEVLSDELATPVPFLQKPFSAKEFREVVLRQSLLPRAAAGQDSEPPVE